MGYAIGTRLWSGSPDDAQGDLEHGNDFNQAAYMRDVRLRNQEKIYSVARHSQQRYVTSQRLNHGTARLTYEQRRSSRTADFRGLLRSVNVYILSGCWSQVLRFGSLRLYELYPVSVFWRLLENGGDWVWLARLVLYLVWLQPENGKAKAARVLGWKTSTY